MCRSLFIRSSTVLEQVLSVLRSFSYSMNNYSLYNNKKE
uniref:Uncharacterized protein n=1 Tax=Lepeophtheirus salmonis TaxID=72036 RepID=A0A0K2VFQ0_LEPSM